MFSYVLCGSLIYISLTIFIYTTATKFTQCVTLDSVEIINMVTYSWVYS